MSLTSPSIDIRLQNTVTPIAHIVRRLVASPADVDALCMLEEFVAHAPLVILKLPRLPSCKDGDDSVPVFRLKLLWALYQNESHRSVRVDGSNRALDVQHVDSRSTSIRRHKLAIFEEGTGIGKSEERRRGGR